MKNLQIIQEINSKFADFFQISNLYLSNIGNRVTNIPDDKKDIITKEIPALLYNFFDSNRYVIKGSVGKGRLSRTPWVAIMDKEITTTTQKGVYIVFLVSSDIKNVYITLGQGTTEEGQFGKRTKPYEIFAKRDYYRTWLRSKSTSLIEDDSIDVADEGYKNCVMFANLWNLDRTDDKIEILDSYTNTYNYYKDNLEQISASLPQNPMNKLNESLDYFLDCYEAELPVFWKDEKYKWEAIKQFQDNWDIEAKDFGSMFDRATSKHGNLLSAAQYFPAGAIKALAKTDQERTREMFRFLFDETLDLTERVEIFMTEAEDFRKDKHSEWNNHYQDLHAISVYLASRYPDKYYIYKYKELKRTIDLLGRQFSFNGKSEPSFLSTFYTFMNSLNLVIKGNKKLCLLLDKQLSESDSCYNDNNRNILTVDFVFYLGKRYIASSNTSEIDESGKTSWIIPGNNNRFKVIQAFEERGVVDWKQGNYKFKKGDICFIYCSDEYQRILFKTEVTEIDIDSEQYINDAKFWVDQKAFEERNMQNRYVRLKLIKALDPTDDRLSLNVLKSLGLNSNIQGPMKVPTKEMLDSINSIFEEDIIEKMNFEVSPNSRYWIYSPGDQANRWPTCQSNGIMSLGWEEMGDLKAYATADDMLSKLREIYGADSSHKNDRLALWQFCHDMKPGDVIYAKYGRSIIVGRGVVQSIYRYDESFDDHNNVCDVKWSHIGSWDAPFILPMKTLTRIGTSSEDKKLVESLESLFAENKKIKQIPFSMDAMINTILSTGLQYDHTLIKRFTFSLLSKPFVILSGLAGSGKTQLAVAFAKAMSESASQYRIVSVGADWTNREPLLGFPNALKKDEYVKPENGVLQLLIDANNNPDKPFFLILDEMNLSYVERYFADFLSVMESHGEIALWEKPEESEDGTPDTVKLPKNLFIIGTINVDETTYMFSPKVLDRANVIEFKISYEEMFDFLGSIRKIDTDVVRAIAAPMGANFVELAGNKELASSSEKITNTLASFFKELKSVNAEFGYRSATEIYRFINQAMKNDNTAEKMSESEILDAAIVQKLLPKLHGSRKKLEPVLKKLWELCNSNENNEIGYTQELAAKAKYPMAADKIARMYAAAQDNGFTSFAEA
ncbi:MAG: DUF3578 domain-containing protein [Lachnospiraceae bacterium]|nr:DUF3578 domain-containing protein [Lachnospiraceae bacterium]